MMSVTTASTSCSLLEPQRFLGVGGRQNGIAAHGEDLLDQIPHRRLVVDDEDRLAAGFGRGLHLRYRQVCSGKIPNRLPSAGRHVSARNSKVDRPRIPPRPAPAEAGADARERIIRTAYELFTRHGLAAVGVDRIVAEANVAKTTLYRHFRSKDDLILAVLERHQQLWLRDWLQPKLVADGASAAERLLAVFDGSRSGSATKPSTAACSSTRSARPGIAPALFV